MYVEAQALRLTFSHPDCHCRLRNFAGSTLTDQGERLSRVVQIPMVARLAAGVAGFVSADVTAGREFHPAPKVYTLKNSVCFMFNLP